MKFSRVLSVAFLSGVFVSFTGCNQETNDAGIQGQNSKVVMPEGAPKGSSQEEYMKYSMKTQLQNPTGQGAGGYPGADQAGKAASSASETKK